jgi:hypothetical protein
VLAEGRISHSPRHLSGSSRSLLPGIVVLTLFVAEIGNYKNIAGPRLVWCSHHSSRLVALWCAAYRTPAYTPKHICSALSCDSKLFSLTSQSLFLFQCALLLYILSYDHFTVRVTSRCIVHIAQYFRPSSIEVFHILTGFVP